MVDVIRLFAPDATVFMQGSTTRLGIGVLADASKCEVVEERNGAFELEMEYPITGSLYDQIGFRSLIVCKPNPFDNPQAFRVYDISKPISGMVTIKAEHVSYDLAGFPLGPNRDQVIVEDGHIDNVPFEALTIDDAVTKLTYYSVRDDMTTSQNPGGPFTFAYDVTHASDFPTLTNDTKLSLELPNTVRAILGGDGGILEKFKGEIKYDNFSFMIYHNSTEHPDHGRGRNNGVTISYGKNLTDLTQDENNSNVYTHLYPYWHTDDLGFRELPEKVIAINPAASYGYTKYLPADLSNMFQPDPNAGIYYPTDAELRTLAQRYMEENKIDGTPVVSLNVSFEMLSKYPEYESIAILEDVKLCDTVNVRFPKLGVTSTAKVIKTTYNALTGKYSSIDLGEAKNTLTTTIAQQKDYLAATAYTPTKESWLERSFWEAGQKIAGNKGGFITLYDSDGDGKPDELLITSQVWDTDNGHTIHDYTGGIWRWNYQGLAFSATGYDNFPQQVRAAITNDGEIDAYYIKTGILQSIEIDAGSNHQFNVSPQGAVTAADLTITGGEIKMGSVSGQPNTYNFRVTNSGAVTARNLTISGGSINIGDRFKVDSNGYVELYSTDGQDTELVFYVSPGGYASAKALHVDNNLSVRGISDWLLYDHSDIPTHNYNFRMYGLVDNSGSATQVEHLWIGRDSNDDDKFTITDLAFRVNSKELPFDVETSKLSMQVLGTTEQPYVYRILSEFASDEYKTRIYGDTDIFIGRSYLDYDPQTQTESINSNRRIWLAGADSSLETSVPFIYYAEKATGTLTRGDTLWRFTSGDYTWTDIETDEDIAVSATDNFPEETFQSSNVSVGGIVQINLSTGNVGIHKNLYVYDSVYIGEAESKLVPAQWVAIDSQLSTSSENPVMNKVITARMNEVFQSVSNGKKKVAKAITDKGVPTANDATFATMADNIDAIPSGGVIYEAIPKTKVLPKKCNFYEGKILDYEVPSSDFYVVYPAHSKLETNHYTYDKQRQPYIDIQKEFLAALRNLFVNTMGLVRVDSNGNHDGWYATGVNTDTYNFAYECFALPPADPNDTSDPAQYLTIRNDRISNRGNVYIGYTQTIPVDGNTDYMVSNQYSTLIFPQEAVSGAYALYYSIPIYVLSNDRVCLFTVINQLEAAANVTTFLWCGVVKDFRVYGDSVDQPVAFYDPENGAVVLRDGRIKSISQYPSMPTYSSSSGTGLISPAGVGNYSRNTLARNDSIVAFRESQSDDPYYFKDDIIAARLPYPSGMSGRVNKVTIDTKQYVRYDTMMYKVGV